MSRERLPPPEAPACLLRPHPSSQKGGTLIAEEVTDLDTHARRLCDPDGYRPADCRRCGHDTLHVHQYRWRLLLADGEQPEVRIVIYICAHPTCGATWRILPALLARRLWRSWRTVERETIDPSPPPARPQIPERTRSRWRARLAATARALVQLLAATADAILARLAEVVGLDGTRRDLVIAFAAAMPISDAGRLAAPAALIHRLGPGLRLM